MSSGLSDQIEVCAEVLAWARTSLSIPMEEAASSLKVDSETLESWEHDGVHLRLTEIEEIARVYRRPSAVFFLKTVPSEPSLPSDHRTLPSQTQHKLGQKSILAIRFAQRVQEEARDVAPRIGAELASRVPRLSIETDPGQAAETLRSALRVDVTTQLSWTSDYEALRGWIRAVEALGVLVLRQPMPITETRAFSLGGTPPVVVLNSSDGVYPRVFSGT